jgi:mono/diheme cytochrome c family protein
VLILAACGRSQEEVDSVRATAGVVAQTAGASTAVAQAATQAAIPTETTAPNATAAPTADPLVARGNELFHATHTTAQGAWMCSQCHSTGSERLIGPGMAGLSARAAARIAGQTADEYIRNSILHPNDYIVEGDPAYPAGLMPQNYADIFSEDDLNALVSYLISL